MPGQGRPRLTDDDMRARVAAYCARYHVAAGAEGLPPFPSGRRETAQHREWLSVYKLGQRLGRRARAQCERCGRPASPGSVFCAAHRLGAQGVPEDERRRLLADQSARCPVCLGAVDIASPVHRDPATGEARALMDGRCARLADLAEGLGGEALERLRRFLHKPRAGAGRRG